MYVYSIYLAMCRLSCYALFSNGHTISFRVVSCDTFTNILQDCFTGIGPTV